MEGGVVHLQLQDDAEEVVHVPRVGVDQDVRDALLLDLAQHRPRKNHRMKVARRPQSSGQNPSWVVKQPSGVHEVRFLWGLEISSVQGTL